MTTDLITETVPAHVDELMARMAERGLAPHAVRVCGLSTAVATRLGLGGAEIRDVALAALLHDVGKLAVPASVLDKPGRLSLPEWQIVREHSDLGERTLGRCRGLEHLGSVVRHVHERFDGYGYPDGVAGRAIPLGARIIAVCDAWDAMRSDRPYRPALPFEKAFDMLVLAAGEQFDPTVVAAVVAHLHEASSA